MLPLLLLAAVPACAPAASGAGPSSPQTALDRTIEARTAHTTQRDPGVSRTQRATNVRTSSAGQTLDAADAGDLAAPGAGAPEGTPFTVEEDAAGFAFRLTIGPSPGGPDAVSPGELILTHLASGNVLTMTITSVSQRVRDTGDDWLRVADYDFDGIEDFAVHDGDGGPYGSPTYSIFLYVPRTGTFVSSPDLTDLSALSLGGVEVDAKRKRLIVTSKSGCSYAWAEEYEMRKGHPYLMFRSSYNGGGDAEGCLIVEETRTARGGFVEVTKPCS